MTCAAWRCCASGHDVRDAFSPFHFERRADLVELITSFLSTAIRDGEDIVTKLGEEKLYPCHSSRKRNYSFRKVVWSQKCGLQEENTVQHRLPLDHGYMKRRYCFRKEMESVDCGRRRGIQGNVGHVGCGVGLELPL